MPVPTHFRLVVRGHFDSSPEEWSFSTKYSRDSPAAPDADLGDINEGGVTTAIQTLLQSANFQSNVVADDWRMYQIGTDGLMEGDGPLLHEFTPNTVKGTGSLRYPPQIALVVTTVAQHRGAARFGRFYLPGPGKPISTDGRITDADAGAMRGIATSFMKSVSDQIDVGGVLVSSKGVNISPGPAGSAGGTRQDIEHLEVGRALDTLRNRRKSLLEERNIGGHIDW